MTRWLGKVALLAGVALAGGAGTGAAAQGSLAEAAERTRQAWLGHDAQAIVGQSAGVVFQIPGADPSAPVERSQAVELLRRHLRAAVERSLTVSAVREVEPGRGYAELERDRKSTRLNSSHGYISYAVFCLKKKKCKKNRGRDG